MLASPYCTFVFFLHQQSQSIAYTATEQILVTISWRECIFWHNQSLNKDNIIKLSTTMTCDLMLMQLPLTISEQFCLPDFTNKDWVKPWYGFHILSNGATHRGCQNYQKLISLINLTWWDLNLGFIVGTLLV